MLQKKHSVHRILGHPLKLITLRTIHINDQSGNCAVKIHDKSANNSLLVNFHRIFAEKKIPEFVSVWCHLSSKPPRIF